jgi:acyl-CoA reductase-like NAD-dependent aldehyde dehydrogenase
MTGGSYDQLFYQPTVLANVPAEARAYQEEIFGPVAPILAFKDIDEAAQLAAQTGYGLSLAIQTTDIVSGLALADRVPVGMVHINDQTSTDEVIAPSGGVGLSGNGYRIGGQEANLEAFTEIAAVAYGDKRRLPIGSVHSDAEAKGSDTGSHQRVPALARSRVGGQLVFERLRARGIAIGR